MNAFTGPTEPGEAELNIIPQNIDGGGVQPYTSFSQTLSRGANTAQGIYQSFSSSRIFVLCCSVWCEKGRAQKCRYCIEYCMAWAKRVLKHMWVRKLTTKVINTGWKHQLIQRWDAILWWSRHGEAFCLYPQNPALRRTTRPNYQLLWYEGQHQRLRTAASGHVSFFKLRSLLVCQIKIGTTEKIYWFEKPIWEIWNPCQEDLQWLK